MQSVLLGMPCALLAENLLDASSGQPSATIILPLRALDCNIIVCCSVLRII